MVRINVTPTTIIVKDSLGIERSYKREENPPGILIQTCLKIYKKMITVRRFTEDLTTGSMEGTFLYMTGIQNVEIIGEIDL